MDQRVAQLERHILTAFLAATVFAGMFERLGGYRSKQFVETGLAGDACCDDLEFHSSCFAVGCLSEQDIRNLFPRLGGGLDHLPPGLRRALIAAIEIGNFICKSSPARPGGNRAVCVTSW